MSTLLVKVDLTEADQRVLKIREVSFVPIRILEESISARKPTRK